MSDDLRDARGRLLRLVLPFAVAITTGAVVFFATRRGLAPAEAGGSKPVDTAMPQLANAALAGLAAFVLTAITVGVVRRRR